MMRHSPEEHHVACGSTVSAMFEDCARRFQSTLAVRCADEQMTYRELFRHASWASDLLRAYGVKAGDTILMDSSRHVDAVVAILAIMFCGATVCPLDPSATDRRLADTLSLANAKFIVTSERTPLDPRVSQLLSSFSIRTIEVQRPGTDVPLTENQAVPEAGGYLLFTSGSTGAPKGVIMGNRGLANLVHWDMLHRGCEPGKRHLQYASFNFDVAFHELFSAISSGGTAIMATQEQRQDPGRLLKLLSAARIQKAYLPYSVLNQVAIAAIAHPETLWLTDVTTAGEPLKITRHIRTLFLRTGAALYNNYGSTEVQDVTSLKLSGDPEQWPDLPSIGTPIAGMEVGVLTSVGVSSAPGSEGPIVVKGCQVAMGYVQAGSNELVTLPKTSNGAADEYLSDDIAIIRSDHSLAIKGRIDRQVKIRGKRVDLLAVETAIERYKHVRQAAAVPIEVAGRTVLVAFAVTTDSTACDSFEDDIRKLVTVEIDAAAAPYRTIVLSKFPETSTGKVDRTRLQAIASEAIQVPELTSKVPSLAKPRDLKQRVLDVWNDILPGGHRLSFKAAGGDSLSAMQLVTRLRQELGIVISINNITDTTTADDISNACPSIAVSGSIPKPTVATPTVRTAVAIIGMAGRFPGANSVDALWEGLITNKTFLSNSQCDPSAYSVCENFINVGGFLEEHDYFDSEFFNISEREALLMDPQHRVFLECSWHALENAGYAPDAVPYRTGVFSASGANTYLLNNILPSVQYDPKGPFLSHRLIRDIGEILIEQGNAPEHISMRVSNKLNLTGPSLAVGSACSGGLVAIHYATRTIRCGEADMAVAGAVSIPSPQHVGYFAHQGLILSPSGCCRPFDADADGTVFGSGCVVFVLKDHELAMRDGDRIIASIIGSAVNNDGARKVSYTGPSIEGQVEVINAALADANVAASEIDYVEAHGTGTSVGDPIELSALVATYGKAAAVENCLVGSLKANIGHLDEAAGAASLLKAALCIQRDKIPSIPTFRKANERMPLDGTRLNIASGQTRDWHRRPERRRRAAITSLGIGGTNCHMIIEEADSQPYCAERSASSARHELFVLSAGSAEQLISLCQGLKDFLAACESVSLRDICMTSCMGRRPERFRVAWAVSSKAELSQLLDEIIDGAALPYDSLTARKIVGLFSGQGSQRTGMGQELSAVFPVFRAAIEDCFRRMKNSHGLDLREAIQDPRQRTKLNHTAFTQPTIFAFEYAMTCLLRSFGVLFDEVSGHSVGEIAALVAAGVMTVEDACFLVSERGRMCGSLPSGLGAMAEARGEPEEVARLVSSLDDGIAVAAFNSPTAVTIAGPSERLAQFIEPGEVAGCTITPLSVSHAFHTEQMIDLVDQCGSMVSKLEFSEPTIPIISSVTGQPLRSNCDWVDYFRAHLVRPVKFDASIHYMLEDKSKIFVEVGPKPVLVRFGMDNELGHERCWIPTSRSSNELGTFLGALAKLFKLGVDLNFVHLASVADWRRVPLPTYPFKRKRFCEGLPNLNETHPNPYSIEKAAAPNSSSRAAALQGAFATAGAVRTSHASQGLDFSALRQPVDESEVLQIVNELAAKLLGAAHNTAIEPDLEWRELGFDSLLLIEMRSELRKRFGAIVSSTAVMNSGTLRRLARDIFRSISLCRSRPAARALEDIQLLLVPGIIGEAMDFASLVANLPGNSYAILEYPDNIDPWRTSPEPDDIIIPMTARAQKLAEGKRLVILGYSFGGKIANEVALALQKAGVEVIRVIILDIPADPCPLPPAEVSPDGLLDQETFYAILAENPAKAFNMLDKACHFQKLHDNLRQAASVYWTNSIVASKLEASRTVIPLTLVRARTGGALGSLLPGADESSIDPAWGWSKVGHEVKVHFVEGDHFSMISYAKVSQLADLVQTEITAYLSC
ncbi:type I polyketide synthase [Rhizobium mayense]|uniref:Beta-ketoacyl synthase N-terminal-like domain-containing protein n=1 Tax=Rhizobium mayense TaxID=1312184 RepID=A0ABT7K5C9_9HYPH|nr:type I polyketide synthase [Rhizobium mayense]MDL2403807.1 beta-ketoacyl synthase N-terminal-like domain-containing protein [Rhizobium mayense]